MNKVDHFAFLVEDIDASIKFYTEKLGFEFDFKETDEEHGESFAFFKLDGGNLELLQNLNAKKKKEQSNPEEQAYCPHLALETDDLEGLLEGLKEKGVTVLKEPMLIPNKVTWAYIQDIDGNIIEYVSWLDKK
jgi:lactoylglutathione lyase